MAYDPFAREPFAVSVRTGDGIGADRWVGGFRSRSGIRRTPEPVSILWFLERTRSSKGMFVLRGADHEHFSDQIDEPALRDRGVDATA